MHLNSLLFALLLISNTCALAQSSTFDTDTEDWGTNADGSIPVWQATGGNPGGWISATDISTGGTWHWVAPPQFLGNVCGSYGLTLSFDLKTSDSQNNNTKPDVILNGDNMDLVYNTAFDPNTFWTNYKVVLKEDAGWRINSLGGAIPTKAQFVAVLSSLAGLQIRGEFLQSAIDDGGLDNVVLETTSFKFDLDENDSTTPPGVDDFRADSSCTDNLPVADLDALIQSEASIDSIVIQLLIHPDNNKEYLDYPEPLPPFGPVITGQQTWRIVLKNNGQTTAGLFREALKKVRYFNDAFPGTGQVRTVNVQVFTGCGPLGDANAFLPYFPPAYAGMDGQHEFCHEDNPADLQFELGNIYKDDGRWYPEMASGDGRFDPGTDSAGIFLYIVESDWSACPNDTAEVEVKVATPFGDLGEDHVLCRDSIFRLSFDILPDFKSWIWSTGSTSPSILIREPGTYSITITSAVNECIFTDSLHIDYVTCNECPVYVPNVFSPDDDGENDKFQAFAGCDFLSYHLRVYDRWGGLIFETKDPGFEWDGAFKSKDVNPGVFFWLLDYETELFGQPLKRRLFGDVTVVK